MENELIALRAVEPEDLDTLYRWENDTSLWRLGNTLAPYSRQTLREYIAQAGLDIFTTRQLRLMIVEKTDARPVGAIDLFDFEPAHRRAGIGILVYDPADRGKGYGAAALDLLLAYCRRTLHLHGVYCNILPENKESRALFLSRGFRAAGIKREWLLIDGKWHDEELYTLLLE